MDFNRFSKKQGEILKYNIQNRPVITILEGAVRSGKTFVNNWLWIEHVHGMRGKGYKFIMTGHTMASLKRNVVDELSLCLNTNFIFNKNNEFEMFGNTMCCFGTDKVDSYKAMKGFTSYGWYGNEVTEHHENSIDQAFKRCSGEGARIFWDTNPAGPYNKIKVDYIDKNGELLSDGSVHIKSWHFVLDDNPFLSSQYVESLKKTTPSGMWYDRDILGLWVAAEGMIYTDFDSYQHIIDSLPEFKEYFAGVDWGYEHNGVIGVYGVDHDGNSVRIKEYVAQHQTLDYWVRIAKKINNDYREMIFYCDPARPDNIEEFRKNNINAVEADNAVVEGITYVAERFKNNRNYIYRDGNKEYLKKIFNYRWKPNMKKEEPIKEQDDEMDSERYALYTHFKKSVEPRLRWI